MAADPKKTQVIKGWPTPKDAKDSHASFWGLHHTTDGT